MSETSNTTDPRVPAKAQEPLFVLSLVAGLVGALLLGLALLMWAAGQAGDVGDELDPGNLLRWILAGGLFLTVLAVGLQFGNIIGFFAHRKSLIAANVFVMCVLATVAVGLVNKVGARYFRKFDFTADKLYSMSDETRKVLENLAKDVEIVAIMSGQERDGQANDTINRLLDQCLERTTRIKVRHIDPALDPKGFERLIRELELTGRDWSDTLGLAVRAGTRDAAGVFKQDRLKHIPKSELWEQSRGNPMMGDEGGGGRVFKGEQLIAAALLEVSEETKPKLYFLEGHQELETEGQRERGIGAVTKLLRQRNYEVAVLKLTEREKGDVPSDASVLVIAGPKRPLASNEVAAIDAYLKTGGHLFVMLDPVIVNKPGTTEQAFIDFGLETLLKSWNIDVERRAVVGYQGRARIAEGQLVQVAVPSDVVIATNLDTVHPITKPLGGHRLVFAEARSLKTLTTNQQAKATEIVKLDAHKAFATTANPDEFFETRRFPKDAVTEKPITLAIAVEQELDQPKPDDKKEGAASARKATRIVVMGDAEWASNAAIDRESNLELVYNSLTWLVGQKRFIAQAKRPHSYRLDLSRAKGMLFVLLALPGMPVFAIALGVLVWILRRR